MKKMIALCLMILALNLFATENRFAGFYRVNFSDASFIQELAFKVQDSGKVIFEENKYLSDFEVKITVIFEQFDYSIVGSGQVMMIDLLWFNDGLPEMMRLHIFGPANLDYDPMLLTAVSMFSDGDALPLILSGGSLVFEK